MYHGMAMGNQPQVLTLTREQTVAVGGEVNSHNLRALVGNNVQEARVLVSKSIVVLAPDDSCEKNVERGNLGSPLDFETFLDPFAVLYYDQPTLFRVTSCIEKRTWFTIESMT